MTVTQPSRADQRVLTGLAGRGITQSRTPWMHEQEGDAQGLRLVYALYDFTAQGWGDDRLPDLLDAVQMAGFAGINVTFPFKQAVIPYLDGLSPAAERIGAVNTVAFGQGKRIGHNTDVIGFAESVRAGLAGAQRSCVLQLGCGGAGAATAHALLTDGVELLLLHDVDEHRASELAGHLGEIYGIGRAAVVNDPASAAVLANGIVNATPVGMDKFPGTPLPEGQSNRATGSLTSSISRSRPSSFVPRAARDAARSMAAAWRSDRPQVLSRSSPASIPICCG